VRDAFSLTAVFSERAQRVRWNLLLGILMHHNQHVYVYFRWQGWIAEQQGRHMSAFFMRDFARQEIEDQEKHNGTGNDSRF